MRSSKASEVPCSASKLRQPAISETRLNRRARWVSKAPSAHMIVVPLVKANPSLAARVTGRKLARCSASAAGRIWP